MTDNTEIPIARPRTKAGIMLLETFLDLARAHRDPRQFDVDMADEAIELERELTARVDAARAALPS